MLIDEVVISLEGGHGGPGKVSFYPGRLAGPDGGNGGRGGDVFIKVTSDLTILNQFSRTKSLEAGDGIHGESFRKSGKDGEDLIITLPLGAEITDLEGKEIIQLNSIDQHFLICKGGKGGKGNFELKSPRRTTPEFAQKGLPGQKKTLKINLKLIADFGLIGLPSSGKSSLLNELTATNVKVGDYPFTTLEPNLGVLKGRIVADIPGLIEGASGGKGLGIRFLKHIEKVKLLIHCLSSESKDLKSDYQIIRGELGKYNPELLEKEEIVLLTKSDLISKPDLEKNIKVLKKLNPKILTVSIYNYEEIEKLKKLLTKSKITSLNS